jgi:F-type H+-transporting ATPase subunit gamma
MSLRREVETRLALFDELSGILGAMRSFALTELRRVSKREAAQQKVVAALTTALTEVTPGTQAIEPLGKVRQDICLLFGSVRGFCGSFNEDVIRCWQAQDDEQAAVILLGERLHQMLPDRPKQLLLSGADNGLNAHETVDRILVAISELHNETAPFRLWACTRDDQGAHYQQLWPLPVLQAAETILPPVTHQPQAVVAVSIADQYLYHQLLSLLLSSIRVENHMRLMQMETALRHLQQGTEDMQRQRNRLRQEEIVEEIELMVCSRH